MLQFTITEPTPAISISHTRLTQLLTMSDREAILRAETPASSVPASPTNTSRQLDTSRRETVRGYWGNRCVFCWMEYRKGASFRRKVECAHILSKTEAEDMYVSGTMRWNFWCNH